jgi:hypothetical protein
MVRPRVNQSLEMYLRSAVNGSPKQWVKWLSLVELLYNSSHRSSLNCSPFKAHYGVEPSRGLTPTLNATSNPEADTSLAERQQLFEMLKDQLARA